MLRLYRRLLASCTTENQANRVHIDLSDRLTPLEWAELSESARRGELSPHSAGWLRGLDERAARSGKTTPELFARRRIARLGFAYSAGGPSSAKTLALCFAGGVQRRLGMAISLFLQHLSAAECDVMLFMDPKRRGSYQDALPDSDGGISGLMTHIAGLYDRHAYRSVVSFGFSMGGLPAIWAALQLQLDVGISVCGANPSDPRWQAADLAPQFRRMHAESPKAPRLLAVYGAANKPDRRSTSALLELVPAVRVPIAGEADHNVPFGLLLRSQLAPFLASVFRGEPVRGMNIVYLHAHDLGRYCEPMGYAIPSSNLMRLAREGVVFRHAFASAPTCAPSRAALLTGEYPHCCGMLGLPSQQLGYTLNDYSRHLTAFLKSRGYETALAGVQHEAVRPFADPAEVLGYDHFLNHVPTGRQDHDPTTTAQAAVDFIRRRHDRPFFLSVGFLEPHRDKEDTRIFIESEELIEPADIEDEARFCQPMPHLADTAVTRREMANFKQGVAYLDRRVGWVLDALDAPAFRDNTLVIFTTDHGPGFPEMKGTLSDRGTGVTLIVRGPGDVAGGRAIDGLAQHLDLYPTICEILNVDAPPWLQGRSLMPLVRGEKAEIHDVVFTEQTYHFSAAPRTFRAARTRRHKYIRCYTPRSQWGIDPGPAEHSWREMGYGKGPHPEEQLFDVFFDPNEANNLATRTGHEDVLASMREHLRRWQEDTDDPVRHGQIPVPPAQRR